MTRRFTMNEAARELRISRRQLQELVKVHRFYYANGRRKLFTEADIVALETAMRSGDQECRSSSSRPARARRRTGTSAAPIAGSLWTEAQRRLADRQRSAGSADGGTGSTVVSFPGRERLPS